MFTFILFINDDSFISSPSIFKPLIYLPCLTTFAKSPSTMLNRCGTVDIAILFPISKGKPSKIHPSSIFYTVGFHRYPLLNQASYLLFLVCIVILKSERDRSISGVPVISKVNDEWQTRRKYL